MRVALFSFLAFISFTGIVSGLLQNPPKLECLEAGMRLTFTPNGNGSTSTTTTTTTTMRPGGEAPTLISGEDQHGFRGHVYVKGHFFSPPSSPCHLDFSGLPTPVTTAFQFTLGYRGTECPVKRERVFGPLAEQPKNGEPPPTGPGVAYEAIVVVQHHRLFVTNADKAYSVTCFYKDSKNDMERRVEIGDLPNQNIEVTREAPGCRYEVLKGAPREQGGGEPVKYANIGDVLVHRWVCDTRDLGMLVHSCLVRDIVGHQFQLVDERGCVTDQSLLPQLVYAPSLNVSVAPIAAFKFADQMVMYFSCQITLCDKRENGCEGITPPTCLPQPIHPQQPFGGNTFRVPPRSSRTQSWVGASAGLASSGQMNGQSDQQQQQQRQWPQGGGVLLPPPIQPVQTTSPGGTPSGGNSKSNNGDAGGVTPMGSCPPCPTLQLPASVASALPAGVDSKNLIAAAMGLLPLPASSVPRQYSVANVPATSSAASDSSRGGNQQHWTATTIQALLKQQIPAPPFMGASENGSSPPVIVPDTVTSPAGTTVFVKKPKKNLFDHGRPEMLRAPETLQIQPPILIKTTSAGEDYGSRGSNAGYRTPRDSSRQEKLKSISMEGQKHPTGDNIKSGPMSASEHFHHRQQQQGQQQPERYFVDDRREEEGEENEQLVEGGYRVEEEQGRQQQKPEQEAGEETNDDGAWRVAAPPTQLPSAPGQSTHQGSFFNSNNAQQATQFGPSGNMMPNRAQHLDPNVRVDVVRVGGVGSNRTQRLLTLPVASDRLVVFSRDDGVVPFVESSPSQESNVQERGRLGVQELRTPELRSSSSSSSAASSSREPSEEEEENDNSHLWMALIIVLLVGCALALALQRAHYRAQLKEGSIGVSSGGGGGDSGTNGGHPLFELRGFSSPFGASAFPTPMVQSKREREQRQFGAATGANADAQQQRQRQPEFGDGSGMGGGGPFEQDQQQSGAVRGGVAIPTPLRFLNRHY